MTPGKRFFEVANGGQPFLKNYTTSVQVRGSAHRPCHSALADSCVPANLCSETTESTLRAACMQYPPADALEYYPMPPVKGALTVNIGAAQLMCSWFRPSECDG